MSLPRTLGACHMAISVVLASAAALKLWGIALPTDPSTPQGLGPGVNAAVALVEVAMALGLWFPVTARAALLGACTLCVAFAAWFVWREMTPGRPAGCGCLGPLKLDRSTHLALLGGLLIAAFGATFEARRRDGVAGAP